ncbi:glycoside hydrolase family 88 protein [Enterovibrio sp. ZSDZ35]|uniref:Glycoside hydrolase family 88 protein n=1 Tax=Enterovibrio qingdaonensis TaxID=2899818 RepID=A0ABT5QTL9_9GAMM|nr:glycoside hydrolase family 88 protein [Enterovibrio sp. ZSDZ35]MDD1783631.1 glycoside hydrolase family 88 protein [Enterovibrio sp. ZSDZ35]
MERSLMARSVICGLMMLGCTTVTPVDAYEFTPNDMLATSQLAHDYWVDNGFYNSQYTPNTNWIYGAYHIGEFEYAKLTGNGKAWDNTLNWARTFSYEPHGSCATTNADHQAAGQVFFELAPMVNEPAGTLDCLKQSISTVVDSTYTRYWSWADTLYMAPAVWPLMADTLSSQTDKNAVYESLYTQFSSAYNSLWNEEYDLWARDSRYVYPNNPSPDGSPMFWSRGNGWVFGGIARLLDRLPENAPHYDVYRTNFVKMATALKNSQQADGFWGADLLEPHHIDAPESSGTTFFVYGMAIGVRLGILDRDTFMPVIKKGWLALANTAFQDSGRLGWAQGVAHEPYMSYARASSSQPYTVGSYLAAASEIYHLLADSNVALNKPVTCSKEPQPTQAPCENAVDGSVSGYNRWASDEMPAWIEIDLGELTRLSAFRGTFFFDRDYQYTVDVKVDAGSQYETVIDKRDNTDGRPSLLAFPNNTVGRYVRINIQDATSYHGRWATVREVEVFGKPANLESIALNQAVNCSDEPQPQYHCGKAVDGRTGSQDRWSAMTFPQSIEVDLGNLHTLNGYALSALHDRQYNYRIETKPTQSSPYQTVVEKTAGDGTGRHQSLPPIVAQYARLTVTGIADNSTNWVSLREWDLYGRDYTPALIQPASFQCSAEPQPQYGCENLFDGSTASGDRWSAEGLASVVVDFGSTRALRSYTLHTYQNRNYAYKLEALNASGQYERVDERSITTTEPGTNQILPSAISTSKIRLSVTDIPDHLFQWTGLTELSLYE